MRRYWWLFQLLGIFWTQFSLISGLFLLLAQALVLVLVLEACQHQMVLMQVHVQMA